MKVTVKTIRENIGLTQEQVSLLTGVPVKTLRNWEQEIRKPSEWTMDLVVDRLLRIKLEENLKTEIQTDDEEHIISFLTIKNKVTEVVKEYDIEKVFLYGSYVKGEATPISDIDLYMESDLFGLDFFEIAEVLRESLHKKIGLLSNRTIIAESVIEQEIEKTGVLIYER